METVISNFQLGVAPPTTNFGFFDYNREINGVNLEKIKMSLQTYGQIMPIMISSDDVIIDGQHRYIALQQLGMDIAYVRTKSYNVDDIDEINNVRAGWTNKNRIESLAKRNYPEFVELKEVIDDWRGRYPKLGFNTIVNAFCGNRMTANKALLKDKTYEVNFTLGTAVLNNAVACKDDLEQWYGAKFIEALKIIMVRNYDVFNIDKFISKLQKNKFHMYNKTTDITDEIVRVYNKGMGTKSKNRIE